MFTPWQSGLQHVPGIITEKFTEGKMSHFSQVTQLGRAIAVDASACMSVPG